MNEIKKSEPIKDVEAYEELSRQLFLELVDLNNTKERIKESKTIKGRYFNFLGYFFSLYCAYKIVMCTGKSFNERSLIRPDRTATLEMHSNKNFSEYNI